MFFSLPYLFFTAGIFLQLRAVQYALCIAKKKNVIALHRWLLSVFILLMPLLGIIAYHIFKNSLREKEFKFFSTDFANKVLYK
jgi:hypothetical protein